MLVQFENENYDMKDRFRIMKEYYVRKSDSTDWCSNIIVQELDKDDEDFSDNWTRIEDTIKEWNFSDGVLIVDNLYTSTDKEIEVNNELKKLVAQINKVRKKYKLSMFLIAHCVKNSTDVDKELLRKQIQGGATLCNNVANVTMVGSSKLSADLGLMKIVKGGRSGKNNLEKIAFNNHWSDDTCTFTKGAIVKNESLHFVQMKDSWDIKVLRELSDKYFIKQGEHFTRDIFKRELPEEYYPSFKKDGEWVDTSISRYLIKMCDYGLIKKIGHNKYNVMHNALDDFRSDSARGK